MPSSKVAYTGRKEQRSTTRAAAGEPILKSRMEMLSSLEWATLNMVPS